ncbi:polysaccharide deacetylase family protein [Mucilaginibacter sp. UR6-11]|uniref:polysaccharide deacetylase family protein n=1 Tax=Mucilaginibacter sp. UR6-11 TaxID=1435644 RepID=UPI001E51FE30|nr:polysaccharide deacetylase family protein [Mucilaginibacter sp. UR6-11]MCC8427176.1 polysaccharide deacetylase family protein [Mucilaginibacter sp. UR6-11]
MDIYSKIRSKVARGFRGLMRDAKYFTGLDKSFYKNARGSRILIYHGICKEDHTRFNPIFLTARMFERHLQLYKKHCNVIPLDDFYAGNFSNDQFNICLTFDDGFANNHHYVLPLLEQYQIPATFFITGITNENYDILWNDFLGVVSKYGPRQITFKNERYTKGRYDHYLSAKDQAALKEKLRNTGFTEKAELMEQLYPLVPFKNEEQLKDYWLQMTAGQIKELAASPFARIGAHGYYHNDLAKISPGDAFSELLQVKQYLEKLTAKPVTSLAFPYGSYNPQVISLAKEAGYNQLLAMDFYAATDALDNTMRERFTVNPFISPVNQLYATITCKYD